jgi:outer membrane receptor protein involved in Fe transport
MLRHLLLTIALVFTSSAFVFSQTGSGTLKGKITDKATKEPIPFANVVVEVGGVQIGGSTSDFDGNYMIKPIPPGKVDLKATYVGYTPYTLKGVVILPDKIQFQNVELSPATTTLNEVEVVEYKVPLISKDQTVSGGTVTSEEISKMANKSADAVATTVGGVSTDANGNITSLRGQRSSGTVYYIDGMRVIGSNALPQSAIEQVEVILGGTPASYGDATGGVISVTTKGPSRDFAAGVELESSEFLDRFGYNRVGVNFTGPVFSKKDTIAHTKTPVMGYFLAGEGVYQLDGDPAAYQLWKVKGDVLDNLRSAPLRLSTNGQGVFLNAEQLTSNDLERTRHTLNNSYYDVSLSGKLDFRLSPTINMSFGGTYHYVAGNNFSYSSSLMNYMYNGYTNQATWRVNARFTQRFPTPSDSKSFVKNVYYSISGDFSRTNGKYEDENLKDDMFKYGYIGSFATQKIRGYTPTLVYDTVSKKYAHLQNGFIDTLVIYTPQTYNPESAAWTSQYYSFFPKDGYYRSTDEIIGNRGLINGMSPYAVYGTWTNVGNTIGSYVGNTLTGFNKNQQDQYSVQASFAADFGNHEIQLGLQYQQRSYSAWGVNGEQSWDIMRGLTNNHLQDLDLLNPQLVYEGTTFMDTINYYRKYVPVLQRNFDINLRKKLGLPVNGTDWIDIDSYNFTNRTINFYDKDQKLHTVKLSEDLLTIDMFDADELLNNGANIVEYYGYDYTGKKLKAKPSFDDFFTQKDANGNYTRQIGSYEPIYLAGYIQDKFAFKDLIFNIGVRVDRFDANQMVLKDPYLFYPAHTAGEVAVIGVGGQPVSQPSNVGTDYVVYVDDVNSPTKITGYRDGSQWYDKNGTPVSDPKIVDPNTPKPYLVDPSNQVITSEVFQDYEPQTNWMPRISFSFPISDDALFYAHYDILTQRPTSYNRLDPISYYFIDVQGASGTINNPNLKPEKTIDYELGFQQKINNASSLKLSVFYRELRDQIQQFRLSGAYPRTYYSYNNIDFGTVKGLTVTYDLRRSGNARLRFNYTLQFANGTGSDPNAASGIIRSNQPNLRTMNPYSYDRRHQFNISLDYRWGTGKEYNGPVVNRKKSGKPPVQILSNLGANLTFTGGSGYPYTKSSKIMPYGAMGPIEGTINGARLPWQFLLNLRIDKDFDFTMGKKKKGATINVYLEILNLLNTKNVVGVYPATGSPSDDGYLTAPEYQNQINQQVNPTSYRDLYSVYIDNPYNYSSPRQTRLGLMFNF